jgi:hypothetical protein
MQMIRCTADLVETRFVTPLLVAPNVGLWAYRDPPPLSASINNEWQRRSGTCHRDETVGRGRLSRPTVERQGIGEEMEGDKWEGQE